MRRRIRLLCIVSIFVGALSLLLGACATPAAEQESRSEGGATTSPTALTTPEPTSTPPSLASPAPIPTAEPTAAPTTSSSTAEPILSDEPSSAEASPPLSSDIAGFMLEDLTVPVGTIVTWINQDNVAHTATSGSGETFTLTNVFRSPTLRQGDSFTFTFTEMGVFSYFCEVHPDFMNATVTVVKEGEEAMIGGTAEAPASEPPSEFDY